MNIYDVKQKITPILEEYGITYAGVFGSIARDVWNTVISDIAILEREVNEFLKI